MTKAPKPIDNLVRARYGTDTMEMRDDGDEGRTLFGHFSVFDTWTEINSVYEGRFLERVAPGSFTRAFADPKSIRVLYEHGGDPSIGNKPIANPTVLRQDDFGAYYEAELFDASYVNDLIPALRTGQLGASFRFKVTDQEWTDPSAATDHNPDRLAERTIQGVSIYELGPCPFGAYPDATAGVRSGTDDFYDRLLNDPVFLARFTERVGLPNVEQLLAVAPDFVRAGNDNPDADQQVTSGIESGAREAWFRSQLLEEIKR